MRTDLWSDEDEATLAQHYPYCDNAQLGRLLKREPGAVCAHANLLGLRKASRFHNPASIAIEKAARELSTRPEGFSPRDIDAGSHVVSVVLKRMAKHCGLICLSLGHRTRRYFATQAAADAYRRGNEPSVKVKHTLLSRANWKPDTPAYYPPGYKFTRCPSPSLDHRTNRAWGIGGPSLMDSL
jgi:hypothetical protein